MRIRTLALATVAGGFALAGAAYAGPLGGAIGGGLGGGASGPVGGVAGGLGGGIGGGASGHGAGGGGGGGSFGGSIGPSLGGQSRIGGGAPGLGGQASGSGSMGGSLGPSLGGDHRIGGGAAGLGGSSSTAASGNIGPMNGDARANSQGAANASVNGLANASPNSALSTGRTVTTRARNDADDAAELARRNAAGARRQAATTATSTLAGLTPGDTVRDASGAVIGTVARIQSEHGVVRDVLVRTANGEHRTIRLAAGTLSFSNNVLTTTRTVAARDAMRVRDRADAVEDAAEHRLATTRASTMGMARANAHAGLTAAHRATTLASLAVGETVRTASGTTLGTVARVERAGDGAVKAVLVRTANGGRRVLHLAPRTLSVSGGVVTTTQGSVTARG